MVDNAVQTAINQAVRAIAHGDKPLLDASLATLTRHDLTEVIKDAVLLAEGTLQDPHHSHAMSRCTSPDLPKTNQLWAALLDERYDDLPDIVEDPNQLLTALLAIPAAAAAHT